MAVYGIEDVAELVGVTYRQLWYALRVGDLKQGTRLGRMHLFDDVDLAEIKRHFGSVGGSPTTNGPVGEQEEQK